MLVNDKLVSIVGSLLESSDSIQKSIFDHDRLIGCQNLIDPIINFWSYMIELFIFLWLIFQFFWQVFTINVLINLKIWTAQSKPWDLSVRVWAYGAFNAMKSDEIGQ